MPRNKEKTENEKDLNLNSETLAQSENQPDEALETHVEENEKVEEIAAAGDSQINEIPLSITDPRDGDFVLDVSTDPQSSGIDESESSLFDTQTAYKQEEHDYTGDTLTVQPVEFSSFDREDKVFGEENKNLEMLLDIRLGMTVELGRCELPIKKILELTRGSIIELDKIAGEPVELYANGKHIANGEVVVIEDNFGLRVTSIINPEERIKGL